MQYPLCSWAWALCCLTVQRNFGCCLAHLYFTDNSHHICNCHELLIPPQDGLSEGVHVAVGHHALYENLVVLQHLQVHGSRTAR